MLGNGQVVGGRRRSARVVAAVLIASLLVACSGGGDGETAGTSTTAGSTTPPPARSVRVDPRTTLTWLRTVADGFEATVEDAPSYPDEPGVTRSGASIRLEPSGPVPPFRLEFDVGDAPGPNAVPVVGFTDGETWTYLEPAWDRTAGTATVDADHFSWWSAFWVDLDDLVGDTIAESLGVIDQSPLPCSSTLPAGWSVTLDGSVGGDLSTCATLADGTLTIDVKNQRKATFIVSLPPEGWTGTLPGLAPLADTLSGWLFNSFGKRALVIPGGAVGTITYEGVQGTGNEVRLPVDQDMFAWAVDTMITAGLVYLGGRRFAGVSGSAGGSSGLLQYLGDNDAVRGLLDCMGKTQAFADALDAPAVTLDLLDAFLPGALACARAVAEQGVLGVVNVLLGTVSAVVISTWTLLELTVDVASGTLGRELVIQSAPLVPATPPAALTSCEGTDLSLVEGDLAGVVCSFPWALVETSTFNGGPTVLVSLLRTADRRFVAGWSQVEDGPGVSGYTVDAIVAAGVPADVAALLFESLDACAGCNPAAAAPPPARSDCAPIVVDDNGNEASGITLTGVDCDTAELVITTVHRQHDPWSMPPEVSVDPYYCTFTETVPPPGNEAGRSGRYECSVGSNVVAWTYDASE